MIDLHAHVLPDVDDGVSDMEEALELCRMAVADGTTTIVATPHMNDGLYNAQPAEVLRGVEQLQSRLEAEGIGLELIAGGEVHIDSELPCRVRERQVLTIGNADKYLLLELTRDTIPQGIPHTLFSLRLSGVTSIITHPECHSAIQENPDVLLPLLAGGSLVQVTAGSIAGAFGRAAERCARELIERQMAHVVASDAHSVRHRPPGMARARAVVEKMMGAAVARRMFEDNPHRILLGESIAAPEPLAQRPGNLRRGWWPWRR